MSSGKWTQRAFAKHDIYNPDIYIMFEKFALQAAQIRPYYSAKSIMYRMRWYTQIEEKGTGFKIDDGWISHYARKFVILNPEYKDFFEFRVRKDGYFSDD